MMTIEYRLRFINTNSLWPRIRRIADMREPNEFKQFLVDITIEEKKYKCRYYNKIRRLKNPEYDREKNRRYRQRKKDANDTKQVV